MAVFLFLIGTIAFWLAVVALIKPLPSLRLGRRRWAALLMVFGVGSCTAGGALMPPPTAEERAAWEKADADRAAEREARRAKAEAVRAADRRAQEEARRPSLSKASSNIRGVATDGAGGVTVEVYIPSAWDDKGYIDAVASEVEAIAKSVQNGAKEVPAGIETLTVASKIAGTDRLGNKIELDFIRLEYPVADLRAANLKGLGYLGVLGLASGVESSGPVGHRALINWCADDYRRETSRAFCFMV